MGFLYDYIAARWMYKTFCMLSFIPFPKLSTEVEEALRHQEGFGVWRCCEALENQGWTQLHNGMDYLYFNKVIILGAKLRELMLKNNMDFGTVELELKKSKVVSHGQKKEGQWVTKHYLQTSLSWTKTPAYQFIALCFQYDHHQQKPWSFESIFLYFSKSSIIQSY